MPTASALLVYRSLGVPDVLADENKLRAAAAALLRRAAIDEPSRDRSDQRDLTSGFEKVSAAIVSAVVSMLEEHDLDEYLGQYGTADRTHFAGKLAEAARPEIRTIERTDADVTKLADSALSAVEEWVSEHPFGVALVDGSN